MLKNLFFRESKRIVHCEMNGKETFIDKTKVLTKISGIINLKLFKNPQIDLVSKTISDIGKPPVKFFIKLHVPNDLKSQFGDLYAIVKNVDQLEQSTHILSDKGTDYFMGSQLMETLEYLDQYEILHFPDTMLFVSANEAINFHLQNKTCDYCGISYQGLEKKYTVKNILDSRSEQQSFGVRGVLWPGFEIGVSDCSEKNPNGTGYLFRTEKNMTPKNLCSNECAVEYCTKNNSIAYFNDFVNGGKTRILMSYTERINTNLQNDYKFRSSKL